GFGPEAPPPHTGPGEYALAETITLPRSRGKGTPVSRMEAEGGKERMRPGGKRGAAGSRPHPPAAPRRTAARGRRTDGERLETVLAVLEAVRGGDLDARVPVE